MKNNSELIVGNAITEFPDRLTKIQNEIINIEKELENMMLYNSGDDLSILIKNKFSNKLEQLNDKVKETKIWMNEYVDNMEVLGKGFLVNKFSKISEFNEAKNIINEDFR